MIKDYEVLNEMNSLIYDEFFSGAEGCICIDTDKFEENKIILIIDDYSDAQHEQYKYKITIENITHANEHCLEKGEGLLKSLNINTKSIKSNKDILEAANFSATLKLAAIK